MTRHLTRRLARLAAQGQAGRVIVVEVAWPLVGEQEDEVVADTLAAAGIDRSDEDLLVLVKRYGAAEPIPPCAASLLSVSPLTACARKAQRDDAPDAPPPRTPGGRHRRDGTPALCLGERGRADPGCSPANGSPSSGGGGNRKRTTPTRLPVQRPRLKSRATLGPEQGRGEPRCCWAPARAWRKCRTAASRRRSLSARAPDGREPQAPDAAGDLGAPW